MPITQKISLIFLSILLFFPAAAAKKTVSGRMLYLEGKETTLLAFDTCKNLAILIQKLSANKDNHLIIFVNLGDFDISSLPKSVQETYQKMYLEPMSYFRFRYSIDPQAKNFDAIMAEAKEKKQYDDSLGENIQKISSSYLHNMLKFRTVQASLGLILVLQETERKLVNVKILI